VKVDREMTVAEFNQKYRSTIPVKRIVGGKGAPKPRTAAAADSTIQR
jgi:hypothetical protein